MCQLDTNNEEEPGLGEIENQYLDGLQLSEAQLKRAVKAIDSSDMRESIIGCVAILCDRNVAREVKPKARKQFEHICNQLCQRDEKCKIEVLFTLLQIPIGELTSSRVMRNLAYCAVKADRFSLRANAVVVLERLAKEGDADALSLIEASLKDPDDKVRTNAQVALRNLKRNIL